MEQFNTIPTSGNWADIAGILDANFLRCYTALVQSQSLIGLDGSNYKGMYTSASALPDDMTEAGWALVGSSLSALQLYVFNDGATDWALFSNETYNFTSWTEFQTQLDALSSQVATIGSKIGDLTELETTDKTDLVSAINEVKNNMSTTAEDTTYEDNYGIGAGNVQDAIDDSLLSIKGNGITDAPEYGDSTWTWGKYCTSNGSLSASQYWGRKAFSLVAGQTISVSTKGSGAGIITKTSDDVTFTVIESVPNNVTTYNTRTYTPSEDETVTVFVRNNASDTQPVVKVSATVHGADSARGTSYDNTQSGIASTNVQDAIDEIMSSSNALEVANGGTGTLDISDEAGYVIARFQGGHVKTKNFDSSLVLTYEMIKQL